MSASKKTTTTPQPSTASTVTTTVGGCGVIRPTRRMKLNNLVLWIDAAIDPKNDDCKNTLAQLRAVVSDVKLCTTPVECIHFLNEIDDEKAFVIASGSLGQQLVNDIHHMAQVDAIYIFCGNKARHEQWVKEWPKVRGIYTSIKPICESLKKVVHENDHNSIPMSFVSKDALTIRGTFNENNLDQLPPTYMYSVIFKNIILEIDDDDEKQMKILVNYCQEQNASPKELNYFQGQYKNKSPVWWYTKEMFLYGMINKALRTFDMEGMVKMGFFIRHLHLQLQELHQEQAALFTKQFTIYRGQGFSPKDFQNLSNTKGGLLSFNNFLSTSKLQRVADGFIQRAMDKNTQTIGVLFVMTIDPRKILTTTTTTTPYALIDEQSAIPSEQEILFTMHTVFRVNDIKSMGKNNRLYEVQLTIADESDPDLTRLTDYINNEFIDYGWYRMGQFMLKVGDFDQAEVLYNDLLAKASTGGGRQHINHQLGWLKTDQGKYEEAAKYYEESLRIKLKTTPEDYISLAPTYSNLGGVYNSMGDYSKALEYYEKSLKIREKALPATHPSLATSYNNFGVVYYNLGDYKEALEFFKKDLEITKQSLPANHPDLAFPYNWFGRIYRSLKDYPKALENFEKCFSIWKQALPEKHPNIAITYSNIGDVHRLMGNYEKALTFHRKALNIQENVKCNPLHSATTYMYLGETYREMKDYSTALKYYQKGLKIREEKLSKNHPDLAKIYHNMSKLYYSTRENNLAMKYIQQAIEIGEENLSSNHPNLLEYRETFDKIHNKKN